MHEPTDGRVRDRTKHTDVTISLRTLDDGAWISVDDAREVGVSAVWALSRGAFCDCEPASVLLEGFTDAGVDGAIVVAGAVGRCLECGRRGPVDRFPVGRIVDGEFSPYAPGGIQSARERRDRSSGKCGRE